jgi:peptidoglycan/xylan/chitin deacetylase (PgdA/CDA1 family)
MFMKSILETVSCTGIYKLLYVKKRLKTYFLHRVISKDHPYFNYHTALDHLTVPDFERRLKFVMKHNRLISLEEYSNIIKKNEPVKENLVLLTFDDGYRCLYSNVFPLLKQYNIPAVVFVTTNCIEQQVTPPHDQLLYILINALGKQLDIHFEDFDLTTVLSDDQTVCNTYSTISRYLKSVPDSSRQSFHRYLMDLLSLTEDEIKLANEMLTWEQLKEMHSTGLVAVGAHTQNHPILSKLDFMTMSDEIVGSKDLIEKRLGIPVTTFAYPNGRLIDVNNQTLEIVRSHFDLAFSTLGRKQWQEDQHLITRHGFDVNPEYLLPLIDSGVIDPFASYSLSPRDKSAYMKDPHRIQVPSRMLS